MSEHCNCTLSIHIEFADILPFERNYTCLFFIGRAKVRCANKCSPENFFFESGTSSCPTRWKDRHRFQTGDDHSSLPSLTSS